MILITSKGINKRISKKLVQDYFLGIFGHCFAILARKN